MRKILLIFFQSLKMQLLQGYILSLKLQENINFKALNNAIDLVHVGRINKGKGQFEVIKACEILKKTNLLE